MSNDTEKPSRLNQRNLGVTNRIWLIILVFLSLLTFSHFFLPISSSDNTANSNRHVPFVSAELKPKNYFNTSDAEPNPFPFCPVYGPGDLLGSKYGTMTISQSHIHLGSGARIQRVLNRALSGQPVTISILGGSVSACHGAGDDPISPKCYPHQFFRWWNSVFPHPASELTNGAMRRTNSGYFGYCSAHHIPDVTDLVIIDLDTEDTPDDDMTENFETLIRSILLRPDQPAILLLGHFSPQVHQTHGFVGPDHWHTVVAQFYDIPHISIRSALFPEYMRDPASINKYYTDPKLSNSAGHEIMADILTAYFQAQICTAWGVATGSVFDAAAGGKDQAAGAGKAGSGGGGGDAHGLFGGVGQRKGVPEELDADGNRIRPDPAVAAGGKQKANAHQRLQGAHFQVPPGRVKTRPNTGKFEEIAPFCVSANDLINPLPPSLFYGSGWFAYHPPSGGESAMRTTSHYWYSTLPTSRLRIPIQVGAGDVGVYYLREPIAQVGEGSAVECWVDDNYRGAKIIENAAEVGEATPVLELIDHGVSRGSHFVECALLGEEGQGVPMFKIVGIFAT